MANKVTTFQRIDNHHEVLAYNPQWGSFNMTLNNTRNPHDIRFADVKRGDLLLCSRIVSENDLEYVIEEYLTLENIKKQFAASQKQK